MTTSRKYAAVLLATLAGTAVAVYSVRAQPEGQIPRPAIQPGTSAPPSSMNHNLVVLDPAHGGPDTGATVGDHVVEKDVTLALAVRLRTALMAAGFTVISTRDSDGPDPLPADQRAEIANRTHAVACIVLHATAIGSGVHVFTSTLSSAYAQNADVESPFVPVPWDMAQAASVDQSLRLASDLKTTLGGENLPVVIGRAAVRPLDNLMCPAVAIELAPLTVAGVGATPVSDANYQQSVATTVTAALKTWRGHADSASTVEPMPDTQTVAQANRAIAQKRPQ